MKTIIQVIVGGLFLIFVLVLGVNEFVRVTPNDQGIISFLVTNKLFPSGKMNSEGAKKKNYQEWTEQEQVEILYHLRKSFENSLEIERILYNRSKKGEHVSVEEFKKIIHHLEISIYHLQNISDQTLEKIHPEFPHQIRKKYQKGIALIYEGLTNDEREKFEHGIKLYEDYRQWGNKHSHEFVYPPGFER